jgi:hypothetical protein
MSHHSILFTKLRNNLDDEIEKDQLHYSSIAPVERRLTWEYARKKCGMVIGVGKSDGCMFAFFKLVVLSGKRLS